MNVIFKIIEHGSADWLEAVKLREDILRKPLGSYFTPEELDQEKDHFHIVGFLNEIIVATAVLVPENHVIKMQRVVVDESQRNLDIGSKMMSFCEDFMRSNHFEMVYCHARDSAVNFYLNNQYLSDGDLFNEDGIPHLKMTKTIK